MSLNLKSIIVAFVAAIAVHGAPRAADISGDATYYEPNGGLGACGSPIQNSDFAVALSSAQYSGGSNCGRRINVHYQGKSVEATVVDLCPGCASGSIDLTPSAFQQLADLSAGRIQVTWDFE
ncbi:barwin-like endoglucanase [Lentinus tigrinus ALCF2SS1-7]|uniref:Barwin-like endoglucanase n=1 Tax=Lentinus tigrinus ALCF2SS1-6 TaxID=1328759 RepID=A0A5C2SJG6_9APHY|nr:barwin-like endoglucanase [Lentinus tigrinus ALCF2SS1-6]RPD78201.1 barwin-like endoglucanase [Lentinus tigrinus ALCF2SS1-7]